MEQNCINKSCEQQLLRCEVGLNLKIERDKLMNRKHPHVPVVKDKQEFSLEIQNKTSKLFHETELITSK